MADIIGSGNKQDKWSIRVTELINWLNENKQAVLVAGDNITLTPNTETGEVEISASGGEGTANLYGTENPPSDVGKDGAIYMKHDESNIQDLYGKIDGAWLKLLGAGKGSDNFVCDVLLENTDLEFVEGTQNITKEYELSKSIDNYEAVLVTGYTRNTGTRDQIMARLVLKDEYYVTTNSGYPAFALNGSIASASRRLFFEFLNPNCIRTVSMRTEGGNTPVVYKVYGLKFNNSSPIIYSLEEREIGVWIDGKPLYEITIQTTVTSDNRNNNWYNFSHEIPDIDIVVNYEGILIKKDGTVYRDTAITTNGVNSSTNINGTYSFNIQSCSKTRFVFQIGDFAGSDIFITVRYTKTTDSAN